MILPKSKLYYDNAATFQHCRLLHTCSIPADDWIFTDFVNTPDLAMQET